MFMSTLSAGLLVLSRWQRRIKVQSIGGEGAHHFESFAGEAIHPANEFLVMQKVEVLQIGKFAALV